MISVTINNQPYLDNSLNTYVVDTTNRDEAICAAIDDYIIDTNCTRVIRSIVCNGTLLSQQETEAKILEVAPQKYWNTVKSLHL